MRETDIKPKSLETRGRDHSLSEEEKRGEKRRKDNIVVIPQATRAVRLQVCSCGSAIPQARLIPWRPYVCALQGFQLLLKRTHKDDKFKYIEMNNKRNDIEERIGQGRSERRREEAMRR